MTRSNADPVEAIGTCTLSAGAFVRQLGRMIVGERRALGMPVSSRMASEFGFDDPEPLADVPAPAPEVREESQADPVACRPERTPPPRMSLWRTQAKYRRPAATGRG
jgi:hypothetical protein